MGINLRLSSSASGTRNVIVNMGGGANLVQRSLFATNTPSLPYSQWYKPGAGSPAVSTSDYHNISGLYWTRPYDLDTMGAEGATIKAREGFRYVWMMGPDHGSSTVFNDSTSLYVGYSNDPQTYPSPSTVKMLRWEGTVATLTDQLGQSQVNYSLYQTYFLVYNPDSAGDKFYIYGESNANGFQHELGLITTADFLTTTMVGPAIPTTTFGGWGSFGRPQRLGVNNWVVYAFGKPDGSATSVVYYKYTSTDGFAWTPDFSKILAGPGPYITVGGADYMLTTENGSPNSYISLLAVDANKQSLGTYTRLSSAFGDNGSTNSLQIYPGPTYLQDVDCYVEDGVASIYATRGFFSGVNNQLMSGPYLGNFPTFYDITGSITGNTLLTVTAVPTPGTVPPLAVGFRLLVSGATIVITSFGTGTGGTGTYNITSVANQASGTITIATNGGLMNQFVDLYSIIADSSAATLAAPVGVTADCVSGVVTVSWSDVLPNNSYRIYRGATVGTQATLIGTVSGSSITDSPTVGSQYFYKVVKMSGGTEQKSRIVNVYCSNNTLMVTRHVNRVINDGGDTSKIDMTFLATADATLTTKDYWKYLMMYADVRFGIKVDGSGFISKVYCLGTTRNPKYGDYTPTTSNSFPSTSSNTSYSATSFRGTTPSWINNASSAHGFFGNGRMNLIQRKTEITMIAAYQRPSGTGVLGLFGNGENGGFYLRQESGASGNVTFAMSPYGSSTYTTATTPFASATTAHVAAAVFDGSTGTAILDGVAGTPIDFSAFYPTTAMTTASWLRGQYGSSSNSQGPAFASGSSSARANYSTRTYNLSNEALATFACLAVFEKGSATIASDIAALYQ